MLAKVNENVYVDIDSVSFVQGDDSNEKENKWITILVVGGQGVTVEGRAGKNILDSFLWKHKNSVYDMIHGSETYKKTIN